MWRFIVEVNIVYETTIGCLKLSTILIFDSFEFPTLVTLRYRIQSTQTHFGRLFEEFRRFVWDNSGQCIMHCYIGGDVGWEYVRFIRIYVQRWSACVARGTQQFFEGSGKSSGQCHHPTSATVSAVGKHNVNGIHLLILRFFFCD